MPHSQVLFGIAFITIITARLIEWLLLMRTCSLRTAAVARQECDAPISHEPAANNDRLTLMLLVLAWLGALTPPLLIGAGIWARHFQE
jgi:hypothetical protein